MDTTVTDIAPETGEATEKETPAGSTGTESVASETNGQAGDSQERAEGSPEDSQQARPRGPSKLDTIKELRAKLRERDSRYGTEMETLKSQLDEMKQMIASRGGEKKPSKTFWEAPEEILEERMKANMQSLKEEILQGMQQRESVNQETTEWKQETSKAAEFIQGQKGISPNDHEDIAEIVRSTPAMQHMRPMERAQYAVYLWQQQRGIGDRSVLKAKAVSTTGVAPAPGGQKTWTSAEIDAKTAEFEKVPQNLWTPEQKVAFETFAREIKDAFNQGRVK